MCSCQSRYSKSDSGTLTLCCCAHAGCCAAFVLRPPPCLRPYLSGIEDPNPFFKWLMSKPFAQNVVWGPHFYAQVGVHDTLLRGDPVSDTTTGNTERVQQGFQHPRPHATPARMPRALSL